MLHPPSLEDQGIRRLLVNRIPFIQLVTVDDLLPRLRTSGTLDADVCNEILTAGGRAEQCKALITALTSGRAARRDWYQQLRSALKSGPPARQRDYSSLCNFMDNTIIFPADVEERKWNGLEPLPGIKTKTSPEGQGELQDSLHMYSAPMPRSNERTKALLKSLREWKPSKPCPEYKSKLETIFQERKTALKALNKDPFFGQLKSIEKKVFKVMIHLELALATSSRPPQTQQQNFFLCFTKPAGALLEDNENWLVYFKYLRHLETRLLIPWMREMSCAFHNFTSDAGTPDNKFNRKLILKVGFLLVELFCALGRYDLSVSVVRDLQRYLAQDPTLLQAWIPIFYGHAKALHVLTKNGNVQEALHEWSAAEEVLRRVEHLALGRRVVDRAEWTAYGAELSLLQGCARQALDRATTALRAMEPAPEYKFVHFPVLRVNVLAHIAIGHISRSEKLAVYFVQYCWREFDGLSQHYLQSLLTFMTMSNTFRQDEFGVQVARNCVYFTQLLLGNCDAPLLAEAYCGLAEALQHHGRRYSPSSNQQEDNSVENQSDNHQKGAQQPAANDVTKVKIHLLNESVHWAEAALKTAKNCMPDSHYALTLYRLVFVECSLTQCELMIQSSTITTTTTTTAAADVSHQLIVCEKELVYATSSSLTAMGTTSVLLARCKTCLARIRLLQNLWNDARTLFQEVERILFASLSSTDHVYLHFLVEYSRALRRHGDSVMAMHYLEKVIQLAESYGVYISWVNEAYASYIEMLSESNQKVQCEEAAQRHTQWLSSHSLRPGDLTWEFLHQQPPKDFFRKWDLWEPKRLLDTADRMLEASENGSNTSGLTLMGAWRQQEESNRAQATTAAVHMPLREETVEGTDDSEPDSENSSEDGNS